MNTVIYYTSMFCIKERLKNFESLDFHFSQNMQSSLANLTNNQKASFGYYFIIFRWRKIILYQLLIARSINVLKV